jgi:hypothetical protein
MEVNILTLVATAVTAIATSGLAILGVKQLKQISHQMTIQGEREKKWATIKACERYDSDPAINHYTKLIWDKSKNGTDYTNIEEARHEVLGFMNYLDSLAIGVSQGVYNEQIVSDHLRSTIYKAVKIFIKGETGEVDGFSWSVNKPFVKPDGFECLLKLYDQWFKGNSGTKYHETK